MPAIPPGRFVLKREALLKIAGSLCGAVALSDCGGADSSALLPSPGSGASVLTGAERDATACNVTPEGEIGPYFVDDDASGFKRSDIRSNLDGSATQTGIPLTLNLYVYDSERGCRAYKGARLDMWHCNALGVYSDESVENTLGATWLRGYQVSDAAGLVTFTTIVPGWYQGRATHIHLKVRSSYDRGGVGDQNNTTQLFFSQASIDHIDADVAPYNQNGVDTTTNAEDRVYSEETKGEMLLSLTGNAKKGFSATFAVHLPIASE